MDVAKVVLDVGKVVLGVAKVVLDVGKVVLDVAKVVLDVAKVVLDVAKVVLDVAKVVLDVGKVVLDVGKVVLDVAKVVLDVAKVVLDVAKVVLDVGKVVLEVGKVVLDVGKVVLDGGPALPSSSPSPHHYFVSRDDVLHMLRCEHVQNCLCSDSNAFGVEALPTSKATDHWFAIVRSSAFAVHPFPNLIYNTWLMAYNSGRKWGYAVCVNTVFEVTKPFLVVQLCWIWISDVAKATANSPHA
ncbi:hypothetical protein EMCRGX_G009687 [Ephydatia muelleri]